MRRRISIENTVTGITVFTTILSILWVSFVMSVFGYVVYWAYSLGLQGAASALGAAVRAFLQSLGAI
jgi:hypothetical protein